MTLEWMGLESHQMRDASSRDCSAQKSCLETHRMVMHHLGIAAYRRVAWRPFGWVIHHLGSQRTEEAMGKPSDEIRLPTNGTDQASVLLVKTIFLNLCCMNKYDWFTCIFLFVYLYIRLFKKIPHSNSTNPHTRQVEHNQHKSTCNHEEKW